MMLGLVCCRMLWKLLNGIDVWWIRVICRCRMFLVICMIVGVV